MIGLFPLLDFQEYDFSEIFHVLKFLKVNIILFKKKKPEYNKK